MRQLLRLPDRTAVTFDEARDKIGSGGEGQVFRLPDHPGLVAKLFADPEPRRRKIDVMLANPPGGSAAGGHTMIAWPVAALADAATSRFVGYLMKRIDKASPFLEVASPDDRMKRRPAVTFHDLLVMGENVAYAVATLHAKGYVIGDVNESNILIDGRGFATLIDTDSFQVPDGDGYFRCGVGRPEFTPPELADVALKTVDRRPEHDRYGLGVLLFQLLMQGWSPYGGNVESIRSRSLAVGRDGRDGRAYLFARGRRPPRKAPPVDLLSPDVEALFVRCFEAGATDPAARPAADEWVAALERAGGSLRTCSRNAGHRYGDHLKQCVWCQHADRGGLDYFPAPRAAASDRPQKAIPSSTAPPPPPPPPPPPGGSSVFENLLTGFLTALANGKPAAPAGPTPAEVRSAEIQPGNWVMQMQSPVPATAGPVIVGLRIGLDAYGRLSGKGDMMGRDVWGRACQQPCRLDGRWWYDIAGKVFSVQITINGWPQPFAQSYRLERGGNGQYLVVTPEGLRFSLHRVS